LTASYLVTRKDAFFDRAEFCRLCSFFVDADAKIDIPPPAIVKPMELWTGSCRFRSFGYSSLSFSFIVYLLFSLILIYFIGFLFPI
jgi:hypothetical protein